MKDRQRETTPNTKVFVVCGRNRRANEAMFAFLRSIGLDPYEWERWVEATAHGSPYVGDVLKKGFDEAQAFVVFMTPDDEARLREPIRGHSEETYETTLTPQPRPNVIFEAGMAMAIDAKRTVLVELGKLRPISDIFGRYLVRIENNREKRLELAQRLKAAGCPVEFEGKAEWLTAGDFETPLRVFDDAKTIDHPRAPARASGALVQVRVTYEKDSSRSNGDRHEYRLLVEIENIGTVSLKEYRVDVRFPKAFLDIESYGAEVRSEETDTHKLIRRIPSHFPQYPNGLHIGDTLEDRQIRYSVTSEHKWPARMGKRDLMQLPVEVTFVADGMAPQRVVKAIRELQEF